MKKLLALGLAATVAVAGLGALAGCGGVKNTDVGDFKVGFIFLHDETSTYDKNFIEAAEAATEKMGLTADQVVFKTGVPEGDECYETACDLAEQGCDLIFANSFGHETYIKRAAEEYPLVEFCHATGTQAHTAELSNFHNAFATIYEGRYLAGIVAGMKLKEMIDDGEITSAEAKIGYVGAFPYAEVISGFTSFYLGARSIVPEATMTVRYTNSWYDLTAEKETALSLIDADKCVLISQHADSLGAPSACEEEGVPNVSYNGSTESTGPNTYLISSRINWEPYFEYIIGQAQKIYDARRAVQDEAEAADEQKDLTTVDVSEFAIPADWTGTIETGSVVLEPMNSKEGVVPEGAQAKIDEVKAQLVEGTLRVFDTSKFTVDGKTLTSYLADVDDMGDYVGETEAVKDGYFHESEYRSAPYFNIIIDGVTSITE